MTSADNLEFLRQENRRYIIGTNKSLLKKFEQELLKQDWKTIREGIEVKLCSMPRDEDDPSSVEDRELFILCRSNDRKEKDQKIVQKSADKIAARLATMTERCEKQNRDQLRVAREIGHLMGQNTKAAHLFEVKVFPKDDDALKAFAKIQWQKIKPATDWHELSDGCYLLRTNVTDWTDEDLWKAYIQLTEAEDAFRIQKSDLRIRPVWHQKQERVLAHILVCFLSFVLWRTLGEICKRSGWATNHAEFYPNSLKFDWSTSYYRPTRAKEIRTRCITRPSEHQKILIERLGLRLPARIKSTEM